MEGVYKSVREYAQEKNISWKTAKRKLDKKQIIQEEIKGKKVIIEPKELLKYLITKL